MFLGMLRDEGKACGVDGKGGDGGGFGWLRYDCGGVVGRAFGGELGEQRGIEGGRAGGKGFVEQTGEEGFVCDNVGVDLGLFEGVEVASAIEGVNVDHHGVGAVDRCPVVG